MCVSALRLFIPQAHEAAVPESCGHVAPWPQNAAGRQPESEAEDLMPRRVAIPILFFSVLFALTAFAQQSPPVSDVIAIDILIEPDASLIQRAKVDNAKLRQNYPQEYSLDAVHAPHITLVQRYVLSKDLSAIQAAVANALQSQPFLPINLTATQFDSVIWGGLAVVVYRLERSPELMRFENKIVEVVQPFALKDGSESAFVRSDGETINADTMKWVKEFVPASSGDKYLPHVTVGTAHPDFVTQLKAAPFERIDFKGVSLTIYQLGNFGTAQKKLWSSSGTTQPIRDHIYRGCRMRGRWSYLSCPGSSAGIEVNDATVSSTGSCLP